MLHNLELNFSRQNGYYCITVINQLLYYTRPLRLGYGLVSDIRNIYRIADMINEKKYIFLASANIGQSIKWLCCVSEIATFIVFNCLQSKDLHYPPHLFILLHEWTLNHPCLIFSLNVNKISQQIYLRRNKCVKGQTSVKFYHGIFKTKMVKCSQKVLCDNLIENTGIVMIS